MSKQNKLIEIEISNNLIMGAKEFTRRYLIEELEEVLHHFENDGLYAIKGLKDKINEYKEGEKVIEDLKEKYVISEKELEGKKTKWDL